MFDSPGEQGLSLTHFCNSVAKTVLVQGKCPISFLNEYALFKPLQSTFIELITWGVFLGGGTFKVVLDLHLGESWEGNKKKTTQI